jgi:hypothetical protein
MILLVIAAWLAFAAALALAVHRYRAWRIGERGRQALADNMIGQAGQPYQIVTASPRRVPPNVAFWLFGGLVVLAGLAVAAAGVNRVIEIGGLNGPFGGQSSKPLADAISTVIWGAVILVNGVYLWRAARRRGLRDRVGRVLIIGGYLLLGVALTETIHVALLLSETRATGQADGVTDAALLTFLGYGIPAAFVVFIGTKLADEKILMTAEVNVG